MKEEDIMTLKDCYDYLLKVLKEYVDMDEVYHPIVVTWIMGTYYHDAMITYPYLYLNATKAGGKTRFMRLGSFVAKNGDISITPSSASLFRQAQMGYSFFFDELEQITRKENTNLRLLLNAAYKRGMTVNRARKVTIDGVETYNIEKFEVFTPIAMANIWGLENVLQDRCITIRMDKSTNPCIVRKAELWEYDEKLHRTKKVLAQIANEFFAINEKNSVVSVCMYTPKNIISEFLLFWNKLLRNYTTTYTTTNYTNYTTNENKPTIEDLIKNTDWLEENGTDLTNEYLQLSRKIWDSNVGGRDLELFLPLIMMGHMIDDSVEQELINAMGQIVSEKKQDDVEENQDNMLLSFLIDADRTISWYRVQDLASTFKLVCEEDWITAKWVGKALKRLRIIKFKRRRSHGIEVQINWKKVEMKCHQLGIESEKEEEENA